MKIVMFCVLCYLGGISVYSQTDINRRELTVIGTAIMFQKADQISFTLSAEGTGSTLSVAVESVKSQVNTIVSTLKSLGFADSDLTTSKFSEGDNPSKLLLSSKKDFRATIEIQIKSDRIENIEETIIKFSQLKVDIYNIRYLLKDDFALTQRVLRQAAERAHSKAEVLANELKTTVGSVLSMEEISIANMSGSQVAIRGGRANETGVYIDGYQQSAFLGSGIGNVPSRTLFYDQMISRMATVKVVFAIAQ